MLFGEVETYDLIGYYDYECTLENMRVIKVKLGEGASQAKHLNPIIFNPGAIKLEAKEGFVYNKIIATVLEYNEPIACSIKAEETTIGECHPV